MLKSLMVVGCGSIGQRHARNARQIGVRDIVLCDLDAARLKGFGEEIGTTRLYGSYQEAVAAHPDVRAAVIATPSGIHIPPAQYLAERGIHVFVEKPLSSDLDGVDRLMATVRRKGVVAMMGQSYRFHEGFRELKRILDSGAIGRVLIVNYFGGQYLPDWHPGMDYRKEYAAQKRLGGGVLLTSFSHTFDTVQWLFGDVVKIAGWKAKLSDLEMDVEDCALCMLRTDRGVVVQCESDFFQRDNRHQMLVFGDRGHVEADFVRNRLAVWSADERKPRVIDYPFDGNRRYMDELTHFAALVEAGKVDHDLDLGAGRRVLELILSRDVNWV